jgi:hypothetical protein
VAYVVLFVASSIVVATSHPPRLPTGYWLVASMISFVLLGTALVTAAFHVYLLLDNRTAPLEGWRKRVFFLVTRWGSPTASTRHTRPS